MVLQHANVVRVVILGKKGVGKSGTFSFYFIFDASSTSESCVLARAICKNRVTDSVVALQWISLLMNFLNYAK